MDLVHRCRRCSHWLPRSSLWTSNPARRPLSVIWDLALIVVGGVILADLVSSANVPGTKTLISGITDFVNSSVRGMLGQSTPLTPVSNAPVQTPFPVAG